MLTPFEPLACAATHHAVCRLILTVNVCTVRVRGQVEEGEFVFYPGGFWHQTENLAEENISVSGSVIDANCYQAVMAEFAVECAPGARQRFHFTAPVCAALQGKCKKWWDSAFKGSFTAGGDGKTCPLAGSVGRGGL